MPTDRPNIILIMTDNQPADLLGCHGNREIHTPHLDAMAAGGIRFDAAYCPNAMCSPCRASVWTGLMPSGHGVHTWIDDRLMDEWPADWNALAEFDTLPEILKRSGYATALIGKYHLGMPVPGHNGIDHWVSMAHGHTLDFHRNRMTVNGDSFIHEGHSVDFFTERAVDYIDARAGRPDQPFFLLLPYNGPYGHWPSIKGAPDNRFAHLYEKTQMNSVPREGVSREAIALYDLRKDESGGGGPDYSAVLQIPNDLPSLRNYYSQMSLIDDGVGQVFQALARNRLEENTLVLFTADHGFSLGHHGFWGHGQATWPSNMHRIAYNIPLLAWQAGAIRPGQTSPRLLGSLDLFATLLDYLGIKGSLGARPNPSRSFAPLLRGGALDWEDAVFFEQEESRALRTPEWLYVKRFKQSPAYPLEDELYDLRSDADERVNVIGRPECAQARNELDARLVDFFAEHADPRFDLWTGGRPKSNTSRSWLWEDAWGEDWAPVT